MEISSMATAALLTASLSSAEMESYSQTSESSATIATQLPETAATDFVVRRPVATTALMLQKSATMATRLTTMAAMRAASLSLVSFVRRQFQGRPLITITP